MVVLWVVQKEMYNMKQKQAGRNDMVEEVSTPRNPKV